MQAKDIQDLFNPNPGAGLHRESMQACAWGFN
jgi:hypothetical protein